MLCSEAKQTPPLLRSVFDEAVKIILLNLNLSICLFGILWDNG